MDLEEAYQKQAQDYLRTIYVNRFVQCWTSRG